MKDYSIKEVIDNLDKLDDYDRTNNDGEQNAIKIAKFVLSQIDPNTIFEIEFNNIKQDVIEKKEGVVIYD